MIKTHHTDYCQWCTYNNTWSPIRIVWIYGRAITLCQMCIEYAKSEGENNPLYRQEMLRVKDD